MSVDPRVIRAEQHREIGNLLHQNVGIVLDRWSVRAVQEQPNATRVHHDVLLDHLQELLRKIARGLKESENGQMGEHCLSAFNHGEQRWENGWSLSEVVRDYQILRLVLFDFLEETLDRPLESREVRAVGLALDEAIAASVVSYVNGREEAVREADAQRAEEDKEIQQRLEDQATALREADRRKNEFLAMLSHELRNPLAPIRNAAHILSLKDPEDRELQWTREVIERQVHQMNRMVDDLLDVSRITQGKFKLQRAPVELATVIAAAVESSSSLIKARQHRLSVESTSEPLWLEGDFSRLVQVVANLLNNAAKYTGVGGEIFLTIAKAENEAAITVRDTGIGIPPALLAKIFEPFIQEDRLPDRDHGGLGIGLALVRNLVDLHGGRVQAFSAGRGQGSQFVIHLPLMANAPFLTVSSEAPVKSEPAFGRCILVVDDSVDSAETLAKVLRVAGHTVETAYDGLSALRMARSNVPDVVMLDIGMPQMDGFEVARRMLQEPELKGVLFIAMTGYGHDDDRRQSQAAGFSAHLVKPVNLEALHSVLDNFQRPDAERSSKYAQS
jgi:signal transduction histidine kinase/ActR/RegA family two-component response regulator